MTGVDLRLTVFLMLAFAASIAVAGVLLKEAPSRALLLIQTTLNVIALFMLFPIYRRQRSHSRDVQQTADSILRKLWQDDPNHSASTKARQSRTESCNATPSRKYLVVTRTK